MMRKNIAGGVFNYTLSDIANPGIALAIYGESMNDVENGKLYVDENLQQVTLNAARTAVKLDVPGEAAASRFAFFGVENSSEAVGGVVLPDQTNHDTVYSFRASFSGFSCSLIDSVPSEIALITLKDVNAFAKWNKMRTTDASALISVGWLQVDNFLPSAPFPVAVCPDESESEFVWTEDGAHAKDEEKEKVPPMLLIGIGFAPKHKSGILVSFSDREVTQVVSAPVAYFCYRLFPLFSLDSV